MSEVELLCDDLAIMADGKLIYNDTMDVFRSEDNHLSLTERFINKVMTPKRQAV
jgi:ABC-type multidrug transport system ATPase subunit